MAQATETFALGAEQVTVAVEIDLSTVWLISGNFAGTIPSGQIGFINGDVNLTGDLIVEGLLTGIDTFTLTGNGFQILFQNGGAPLLAGVEKTAWCRWGDTPIGWEVGDRLAVAPTAVGVWKKLETIWQGSWASTTRPANTGDVPLVGGSIARPEVVNLAQTIALQNLRRIHFHDGAGVASMKWLRVLNSGTTGVLAEYPIHFHLNGETSRGSLLEGVVVERGNNHAFVPHGSHGITFKDCAAVLIRDTAYWWDPPPTPNDPINHTRDTDYDGCLALGVWTTTDQRLAGFLLDGGSGNKCNNCAAAAIEGWQNSSGFSWPEIGGGAWEFNNNLAHNCTIEGIFVWQNSQLLTHVIDGFTAYRCGKTGIEHGAYANLYTYRNIVLTSNPIGLLNPSVSLDLAASPNRFLTFEDVVSSNKLVIGHHNILSPKPVYYRRCTFPQVQYQETAWQSYSIFQECGLHPTNFLLTQIKPQSVIEIYEAGVLVHRWAGGWT